MASATVELHVGARILTNRGVAVITELDRHGVHLKDFTGHTYFTAFTQLEAREITAKGVQGLHASLLPWFAQLPEDVQAAALFRQECVMEVETGYRSGLAELAQPGEPARTRPPSQRYWSSPTHAVVDAVSRLTCAATSRPSSPTPTATGWTGSSPGCVTTSTRTACARATSPACSRHPRATVRGSPGRGCR